MANPGIRCGECRFFLQHSHNPAAGTCHANPPIRTTVDAGARWPEVRVDGWCDKFMAGPYPGPQE